ncbi:hypothetical protein JCM3770_007162, partial [Rhodotorula araucariae]
LTESHTAEYPAATVFRLVTQYSLKDRLAGICSDNASAMAKSMELLSEKDLAFFEGILSWIRCFAHILDLVTKAILQVFSVKDEAYADSDDNYEPSFDKVAHMFFRQQQPHADHDIRNVNDLSDKGFEALLHQLDDERDEDDDLSHLKPREELVTDMYKSVKARGTLLKFQSLGKRLRYSGISLRNPVHIEEADFCLAEDLVPLLKPIANLIAAVSKAKAVRIGNIIRWIDSLLAAFDEIALAS